MAIINYDYQKIHRMMFIPLFEAYFYMNINSWKTFIAFL